MKLKNFKLEPELSITYTLKHVHEKDVLEQDVTLTKTGDSWTTTITLPGQKGDTPDAAMKKLGETLYRVSEEIVDNFGNFGIIELDKLET